VEKAGGKLVLPKSDGDAAQAEASARGKRAKSRKPSGGEQTETPSPAGE
jgi:hypothetical protein